MMDTVTLLLGDCAEKLKEIPDASIDLVVTSPPYDNLREYKGYSFAFEKIAAELCRVTKAGGVIVWVVGDATVNGSESLSSFKQAIHFKEILGLNLHDTMIYSKIPTPYDPKCKRYWQAFEYMFVFSKGRVGTCNYLLDPCKKAGKQSCYVGQRHPNGVPRLDRKDPDRIVKDTKVRQNIWFYYRGQRITTHPAPFPIQLAKDHILSWSNEGDIVLDPFLGSGTTGIAAIELNRKFVRGKYILVGDKKGWERGCDLDNAAKHKITEWIITNTEYVLQKIQELDNV